MKSIHILTIGKIKDSTLLNWEESYTKRTSDFDLKIHELKTHEENLKLEAKEIIKKLSIIEKKGRCFCCLLTEHGREYTSQSFSSQLYSWLKNTPQVAFLIGGASGHGQEVINRADFQLSLSQMTYPHQLARLLLVEQLYRAQTTHQGHPYSK